MHAIGKHLDLKGVPSGTPLYVQCDLPAADPEMLNAAVHSLKAMGYDKITLQGRPRKGKSKQGRKTTTGSEPSREIRAMHAYYLGMISEKYIGNAVSTFSALLLLERQNLSRWSTFYKMGGIPLMDMLPFFHMPWVFTYNGENQADVPLTFQDYCCRMILLMPVRIKEGLVEAEPSSRVWHLCDRAHVLDEGKVSADLFRGRVPILDVGREDWACLLGSGGYSCVLQNRAWFTCFVTFVLPNGSR